MSNKRKAKYWKQGEVLPKKYANYTYSGGFLVDPAGNKVVKNIKTAGTPRSVTINAQAIYVGLHHAVRSKIVNDLHTLFHDAFKKQYPPSIALGDNKVLIALHFYDLYSDKLPDLDNLANLFVKCGIDCLTTVNNPNQTKGGATHKLGIIPDDKAIFIPHIVYEFTPVTDVKDRRLDFNLYVVSPHFSVETYLDTLLEISHKTDMFAAAFNPWSKGDKLYCTRGDFGLTAGKIYEITDSDKEYVQVINDLGNESGHPFRIFSWTYVDHTTPVTKVSRHEAGK